MRIISGSARGTHIQAPAGMDTRPVTDKIRQSLFNIFQFDIPGSSFLDLFSGSGSMGLEALSRGAEPVVMVEKGKEAASVIRQNIRTCHFEKKDVRLMEKDVFEAIADLKRNHQKFDFIYLDPPYTVDEIFHPSMEALGDCALLEDDAVVIIRTRKTKEMNDQYGSLVRYRTKDYGISRAHFYRRIPDETEQNPANDANSAEV